LKHFFKFYFHFSLCPFI